MADVVIRRAGVDDAFVVAALHLQCSRERGLPPERGFLDRFADAWLAGHEDRPAWFAEWRGEHAGVLETVRVRRLPWPGLGPSSELHVEALYVPPAHRGHGVGRALVDAMVGWARDGDVRCVRLNAVDEPTRRFFFHLGFRSPHRLMELDLRTAE
jgi:GNAT superfamily N-acetyltransferase